MEHLRVDIDTLKTFDEKGFKTISVNGNRPEVLQKLTQTIGHQVEQGGIRQIILVSHDANFRDFCLQAATNARISVWLPVDNVTPELKNSSFETRLLSEIVSVEKEAKVDVRLDFENLLFGLEKQGYKLTPQQYDHLIRSAVSDIGGIPAITAYADWRVVREHTGIDFQDEFEALGIRTRYQKSWRGKNSADMEIANDIRSLVEKDTTDAPDVIVLASHDRDFRPSLETARKRGKRIVMLALPTGLSQELRQVADEIRYLVPDALVNPTTRPNSSLSITPWDTCAELVAVVDHYLFQRHWGWVHKKSLVNFFHSKNGAETLNRAIQDGILISVSSQHDGLKLNSEHPLVQGFQALRDWILQRIQYALEIRHMPYVDTNYLCQGMAMDDKLRAIGIGKSRSEIDAWLNLLYQSGCLEKRIKQHPKDPKKLITTWQLKNNGQ